jgi:hypothetical protein
VDRRREVNKMGLAEKGMMIVLDKKWSERCQPN